MVPSFRKMSVAILGGCVCKTPSTEVYMLQTVGNKRLWSPEILLGAHLTTTPDLPGGF